MQGESAGGPSVFHGKASVPVDFPPNRTNHNWFQAPDLHRGNIVHPARSANGDGTQGTLGGMVEIGGSCVVGPLQKWRMQLQFRLEILRVPDNCRCTHIPREIALLADSWKFRVPSYLIVGMSTTYHT